jgi:hypothetical protein
METRDFLEAFRWIEHFSLFTTLRLRLGWFCLCLLLPLMIRKDCRLVEKDIEGRFFPFPWPCIEGSMRDEEIPGFAFLRKQCIVVDSLVL